MPEAANLGLSAASRVKYWSELTTEEKVERTREQVLQCLSRFQRLEQRLNDLEARFKTHDHLSGRVVNDQSYSLYPGGETLGKLVRSNPSSDEVYF